jgi:glycerophosphoryl diester phosphodiesterase
MLIIGHRGASGFEPENTIRSFQKSIEAGLNMVEFDIRRSKDGELVVFHDFTLKRLFGINKMISGLTLSQLQEISVNRLIPTLDEALASVNSDIDLDVKVYGEEERILSKIKNFPHKVLITSWNPFVLKKIRALDRNIPLGPVVGFQYRFFLPIVISLLININIYSITIGSELVNTKSMESFRKLGWKVFPFPVNDEKEFRRLRNLGVAGVFTDHSELIKQYEQSASI